MKTPEYWATHIILEITDDFNRLRLSAEGQLKELIKKVQDDALKQDEKILKE